MGRIGWVPAARADVTRIYINRLAPPPYPRFLDSQLLLGTLREKAHTGATAPPNLGPIAIFAKNRNKVSVPRKDAHRELTKPARADSATITTMVAGDKIRLLA